MTLTRGIRRAARASIWGRESVSAEDARIAGLLRYALPAFDVFVILFGALGFVGGVPALRVTFSDTYAEVYSLVLAGTAAVCLAGIAFPAKLWRVEFVGKAFLFGLIVLYAGAVFIAGFDNADTGRAAVGAAILAMSCLPAWRLTDIERERRKHGWR